MAVNRETNQTVALVALLLKHSCCITCMKDIKFPSLLSLHERRQHAPKRTHPRLYVQEEHGFCHISNTSAVVIQHRHVETEHPFGFI